MKKLIVVIIIVAVVGGLGYLGTQSKSKFEHHGLLEEIHKGVHYHDQKGLDSIKNDLIDTSEFLSIHAQNPNVKSLFTEFRAKEIMSFPCQNCHNASLAELQAGNKSGTQKAHWDIELNHADTSVMNCLTCHNSKNLNSLTSISGQSISIDRSFEMCGQCHSTQYKDWIGGAHGKSLSGWKPPRVIKTCVGCHNPHDPSIKSRWPSRLVNKND